MKIVFYGDSITDASRLRSNNDAGRVKEEYSDNPRAYGSGYVFLTATELLFTKPHEYTILNRGIGGDRLPQIYARMNLDVWSEKPDVISILVGVNDVNRGDNPNFTELSRFGRLYRMMLNDTLEKLPNVKIILCEPFTLRDDPEPCPEKNIQHVREYAEEVRKIAEEFDLPFVALQKKLDEAAKIYGAEACCHDLLHPALVGSKIISDEWLKVFNKEILNK